MANTIVYPDGYDEFQLKIGKPLHDDLMEIMTEHSREIGGNRTLIINIALKHFVELDTNEIKKLILKYKSIK